MTASVADAPDAVEELPPTARLCWLYLSMHGESSQSEIASGTGSPQRTVRAALEELEDAGAVSVRHSIRDCRVRLYSVSRPLDTS